MPIRMNDLFMEQTTQWFKGALGEPTAVQEEAWPAIARGENLLVSAPTGTGKTLSAFLVYIDRLKRQARDGELRQELQVIYVSPLKSLAGDIRENLRRPLEGLKSQEEEECIHVAIRTGDTTPAERRQMIKRPPHILITTPESLYLLLTSGSGRGILRTAQAVILDELHAMIDTKRGAHLMLSLARLDHLCRHRLQRIGLSATIEPLETAALYLSSSMRDGRPDVTIVSPRIRKDVRIEVTSPLKDTPRGVIKDPIWEELSRKVYAQCEGTRSVIAFVEGRRFAEKLAYYVNQLGGEGFARTHHGSLSKEQRLQAEQELREGKLRLLCATSSMELGIDVGDIDQVLQVGCPFTISGTMQRLGRAGHNPGRVSIMHMYPRTAPEGLFCGLTAQVAREGGVEYANPPLGCLDVLAQHLVSMAAAGSYTVDEIMDILSGAYTFRSVTKAEVESVLRMLAGDYEHDRDIPVRPRLLYDRIGGRVEGDPYSRMLAVSAGGTIPDKGLYTVKTEEGVKLGELDEEFVYESARGDRFLLGTFAWKITRQDKDTVYVTQAPVEGARLPFWKGETKGRSLRTSLKFGAILGELQEAWADGTVNEHLGAMGLDEAAAGHAAEFIGRQIRAAGGLPDDKTVIVEHFKDQNGTAQAMVHAMFGRQVNAPLSLLIGQEAKRRSGLNLGNLDSEDGFVLYSYDGKPLPEGLLQGLLPSHVRPVLEALLPATPVFNMTFRYNAARALLMGVKKNGRQPLWMQRLKSADMLDQLIHFTDHPLIRETRRECLNNVWDLDGVEYVLNEIRAGAIRVREIYTDTPSPMSLPMQWKLEAENMYDYYPSTGGVQQAVEAGLTQAQMIDPARQDLIDVSGRQKLPQNENQLHTLLMTEGDLIAGEVDIPIEWLEQLAHEKRVLYLEPGLWIAAEQKEEYERALSSQEDIPIDAAAVQEAREHIVRRLLRYRASWQADQIADRYFWPDEETSLILDMLVKKGRVVEREGMYYHADLFDRARRQTIRNLRSQISTVPASHYAALVAGRIKRTAPPAEQLREAVKQLTDIALSAEMWEKILFPARVGSYHEGLLDNLLAEGEYFWKYRDGAVSFHRYEDIDWESSMQENAAGLTTEETLLYEMLSKRGASFMNTMSGALGGVSPRDALLLLVQKGLVCADSFVPVRQSGGKGRGTVEKESRMPVRQRVRSRVMTLNAGRFDVVHSLKALSMEERLNRAFDRVLLLCRETASSCGLQWSEALELLRIWEYTGKARRGYFVEGLSGAQFIRDKDFASVTAALRSKEEQLIWLGAVDPAFVWGKSLLHMQGREIVSLPGNAAGLYGGIPVMAVERQGKIMRVFEEEKSAEALQKFTEAFVRKQIYPSVKRLTVKEYPKSLAEVFGRCGFIREMQDYVLYR